ncbi:MAG: ABC transporter ATP-binding protein [Candidatus Caldarchaeum sp.]|jgi:ABC-2 type transport system ATP-binding protein|uniref:ABC transporter ATP-binding protein n=1 Tax=Caldiarchaeum subterraneum TaxID=311458 RepID=A0A7C4DZZ7_CALS0|nr:ABC transporter ATP-binding protein [Candidatus Caldarchaeales archaeon]
MSSLIEAIEIWKSFGKVEAVRGVSFRLEAGQVHGLLGPNGSGKTTSLKCIVGLLKPDKGTVTIFGEKPSANNGYRRKLGYVPENPSLPDYLTVEEFLIFSARLKGLVGDSVRSRVSELMEAYALHQVSDRLVYELSKGVRQRLAIAASLVSSPTVLILDEPFNGLDPEAQKITRLYINEIIEDGGGVLISTHLLDSAEKICNHVTIIVDGKVLCSSSLSELKSKNGGASLEEIFLSLIRVKKAAN